MSTPTVIHYCISNQPEHPEVFQNVSIQHHNLRNTEHIFNVKICVRFQLHSQILNIPILLSCHYISRKQFFQRGSAFLRSNLSHQLIPVDVLDVLVHRIMWDAKRLFESDRRCRSYVGDIFTVYPLAVEVVVELPLDIDEVVDAIEGIVLESMQQVRTVPASTEAIHSLNTLKLQQNDFADTNQNQCCICLEDFHEGVNVSAMPCQHIYHNDCIVQWLKTCHLCPLCRYPMPI